MKAWAKICPLAVAAGLLLLLTVPSTRAVDPVDFLESLKDDDDLSSPQNDRESSSTEYPNGVNVIPGEAEVNYPIYSTVPKSSFSCIGRPVGFYADTDLRCQVWHICDEESRQQSFLCTNGTIYSQEKRVCDWWYNVNCDPTEVNKNYLQNYDLYKGPPPKSENQENNENNNNNKNDNNNDYKPQTKVTKDPFYNRSPSSRPTSESQQRHNSDNDDQQFSRSTPSYNEPSRETASSFNNNNYQTAPTPRRQPPPPPPTTTRPTTTTTYRTPPPPAALEHNNPFTNRPPQQQRPSESKDQTRYYQPDQQQQKPNEQKDEARYYQPPQQQQRPNQSQRSNQQQQQQKPPAIQTKKENGKRIVEIRVPLSQIPPEILAKYGKRIPEHILKEIFLNFTRGQQQVLQQEAINTKPGNPTGAGNTRSPPPTAPIARSQPPSPSKKPVDFGAPPKPSSSSNSRSPNNPSSAPRQSFTDNDFSPPQKSPSNSRSPNHPTSAPRQSFTENDYSSQQKSSSNSRSSPNNPTSAPRQSFPENDYSSQQKSSSNSRSSPNNPTSAPRQSFPDNDSPPPPKPSHSGNSNPPPPPAHAEHQLKFRHSTPRKVDGVKFATPTRELLAEYDEERQLVGESQNPIYSLQQLFSGHHSRTSKSKPSYDQDQGLNLKEAFTFATTTTTTTTPYPFQQQQQYQEPFARQTRRRTQATTTTTTTTTEEPQLITDRYVPVKSQEEKRMAEIRRIFLVAKQGIKVLPPVPVLSKNEEPFRREVTQRPPVRRTTEAFNFPPVPKVAIPDDYYVKNERFQEAESRYPQPSVPASYLEPLQHHPQPRKQPRPTTTTTSTTTTTTTSTTPAPTPYYQEPEPFRRTKPSKPQNRKKALPPPEDKKQESTTDYDDAARERPNTDELELLRLAQEYIELTGQDFGVRQRPKNA